MLNEKAVNSFLSSMDMDLRFEMQILNARVDRRLYRWSPETFAAVEASIMEAYKNKGKHHDKKRA